MTLTEHTPELEDQAVLIAGEIFNLINQYTDDSTVAKFFLPDEIATACYGLTAGFTACVYTPVLPPEKTLDSALLSFYYALVTYGFNMYLKERSLKTNAAPYILPTEKKRIAQAQKNTLKKTTDGELTSTPLADKIIEIITENVEHQMDMKDFHIKKYRINKKKFWDYTKLSMYWGYNFGKELMESPSNKKITKKTSA